MKRKVRTLLEFTGSHGLDQRQSYELLLKLSLCEEGTRGGKVPRPLFVTIDPVNACNLKCRWCNADFLLRQKTRMISRDTLYSLIDFLLTWDDGVDAVTFSGGGEPLVHPQFAGVLEKCLQRSLITGISTNGVKIGDYAELISRCHWVGVSVDAGSGALMKELKGYDYFDGIMESLRRLTELSRKKRRPLTEKPLGCGVLFRYLVSRENVHELALAARKAKEAGCGSFYYRPASLPWHRREEASPGDEGLGGMEELFLEEAARAGALEDRDFRIWGYTDTPPRTGRTCRELLSTALFMPALEGSEDEFDLGLCYDRRGDEKLLLGKSLKSPRDAAALWGSGRHRDMVESIDTACCPRCPR
ncbi:MAG: radical SAM protein [Candidatus Eremiobacteraeota bacterium]|nr:radical SAM protein [Candidatus Eremiobacteraeota bacterium]